ncbi:hypothetical protein H257_09110 [Aphanomyces astaci]|uniref:Uncharacterized protein n=1 Tax=Aphanomyces astaci TaxID=112090 RepID=W4GE42_APHAT|nr:hypothetical protein H257_09110 [Aphanomyces astaci]ETV77223.1 hypothetical protein H257_09110 [Aphanomyces astaci]|eukprot:XP_009833529.1 hypothetical protein H257_09110 [Aphanomyces astaci]
MSGKRGTTSRSSRRLIDPVSSATKTALRGNDDDEPRQRAVKGKRPPAKSSAVAERMTKEGPPPSVAPTATSSGSGKEGAVVDRSTKKGPTGDGKIGARGAVIDALRPHPSKKCGAPSEDSSGVADDLALGGAPLSVKTTRSVGKEGSNATSSGVVGDVALGGAPLSVATTGAAGKEGGDAESSGVVDDGSLGGAPLSVEAIAVAGKKGGDPKSSDVVGDGSLAPLSVETSGPAGKEGGDAKSSGVVGDVELGGAPPSVAKTGAAGKEGVDAKSSDVVDDIEHEEAPLSVETAPGKEGGDPKSSDVVGDGSLGEAPLSVATTGAAGKEGGDAKSSDVVNDIALGGAPLSIETSGSVGKEVAGKEGGDPKSNDVVGDGALGGAPLSVETSGPAGKEGGDPKSSGVVGESALGGAPLRDNPSNDVLNNTIVTEESSYLSMLLDDGMFFDDDEEQAMDLVASYFDDISPPSVPPKPSSSKGMDRKSKKTKNTSGDDPSMKKKRKSAQEHLDKATTGWPYFEPKLCHEDVLNQLDVFKEELLAINQRTSSRRRMRDDESKSTSKSPAIDGGTRGGDSKSTSELQAISTASPSSDSDGVWKLVEDLVMQRIAIEDIGWFPPTQSMVEVNSSCSVRPIRRQEVEKHKKKLMVDGWNHDFRLVLRTPGPAGKKYGIIDGQHGFMAIVDLWMDRTLGPGAALSSLMRQGQSNPCFPSIVVENASNLNVVQLGMRYNEMYKHGNNRKAFYWMTKFVLFHNWSTFAGCRLSNSFEYGEKVRSAGSGRAALCGGNEAHEAGRHGDEKEDLDRHASSCCEVVVLPTCLAPL